MRRNVSRKRGIDAVEPGAMRAPKVKGDTFRVSNHLAQGAL